MIYHQKFIKKKKANDEKNTHTQTLIRYISEASQYILRLKLNDGCERVTADDGPGGEKIEEMF